MNGNAGGFDSDSRGVLITSKMLYTYILKYLDSKGNERYYCGCTTHPTRRIKEHILGEKCHYKKGVLNYFVINGNFEKSIKFFGVRKMYKILVSKPALRTPLESEGC